MTRMFVPGPVDVAPEVLQAMTKPMLPHRSKEYEEIHRRAAEKAQKVFYTQFRVFLGTHSGSGMQEAGIRNFANKDILCCTSGAFSERWYQCALANGKQADRLDTEWGKAIQPDRLRDALKKKHFESITIVHNETSTGVENPVEELCKVLHEVSPDTIIMVDAVSSLGGVKIEMDEWGIDFLLTSSQKCFALPPGLSMAGVSDRALKKAESVENRGWYFDLLLLEKHRLKDSTPMTPVLPLIYALDFQLDRMFAEGLDARFQRHAAMSQKVYDWSIAHGLKPYPQDGYRSKTVATVNNDKKWVIGDLNKFLLQKGMRIANGYGAIKDVTFRVATMGETSLQDVDILLSVLEDFMRQ
jgi:aspartate aminotransferase-like enzyme